MGHDVIFIETGVNNIDAPLHIILLIFPVAL